MSTIDPDTILTLAAQRAAGMPLSKADQAMLERAMLDDPDLALLIVDAGDIAAQTAPAPTPARTGKATLAALIFGLLACFGVGATAGAQLANGLVGPASKSSLHQIDVRPIGDGLSLSFDAARKRK